MDDFIASFPLLCRINGGASLFVSTRLPPLARKTPLGSRVTERKRIILGKYKLPARFHEQHLPPSRNGDRGTFYFSAETSPGDAKEREEIEFIIIERTRRVQNLLTRSYACDLSRITCSRGPRAYRPWNNSHSRKGILQRYRAGVFSLVKRKIAEIFSVIRAVLPRLFNLTSSICTRARQATCK